MRGAIAVRSAFGDGRRRICPTTSRFARGDARGEEQGLNEADARHSDQAPVGFSHTPPRISGHERISLQGRDHATVLTLMTSASEITFDGIGRFSVPFFRSAKSRSTVSQQCAAQPSASRTERMNDIEDLDSLLAAVRRGHHPKYLMFWGHRATSKHAVGKECLSQWWPAPLVVDEERYGSAEHFMMAEKARVFGDEETRLRILQAPNPGAAKRFGREVRGFQENVWVGARLDIVDPEAPEQRTPGRSRTTK
jgi:hypothetical protein